MGQHACRFEHLLMVPRFDRLSKSQYISFHFKSFSLREDSDNISSLHVRQKKKKILRKHQPYPVLRVRLLGSMCANIEEETNHLNCSKFLEQYTSQKPNS